VKSHGKRSTYSKGCRCEPCTAANTVGQRKVRGRPDNTREKYLKATETPWRRGPERRVQGGPIVREEAMSFGEWAKERGYDPTTKSYQEAV